MLALARPKSVESTLYEALCRLGGSPDAIAARLKRAGVTGLRLSNTHDALARFFRETTGFIVEVGATHLFPSWGEVPFQPVPLTSAAVEFVRRYDRGDFPDLLEDDPADPVTLRLFRPGGEPDGGPDAAA